MSVYIYIFIDTYIYIYSYIYIYVYELNLVFLIQDQSAYLGRNEKPCGGWLQELPQGLLLQIP